MKNAVLVSVALAAIILASGAHAREPTQLRKCQTISRPGSYELADNLVASGGDCLVITADFVIIDLAGFSITGPGGTGILAAPSSGQQRIAVRNGSITGFSDGVDLSRAGSIVEGLQVFRNFGTGIIASGIVKGNTATETFFGPGIVATGVVTGNYVGGNRDGMEVGQGSTVIGNTVTGSRSEGLVVRCPSNVTDNTAINNGIDLPGHPNITLSGEGCNNTNNVAP
jgi:hypothetical protein